MTPTLLDLYTLVDLEAVRAVEWTGSVADYDTQLAALVTDSGQLIVNPTLLDYRLAHWIPAAHQAVDGDLRCWVWHYQDQWVAKLFPPGWSQDLGYHNVQLTLPQLVWRRNPDLDYSMTFEDNPMNNGWYPDPWDRVYAMTWYLDPCYDPQDDHVWVISCSILGHSESGNKDMGTLTPEVAIEFNPQLPLLIDPDSIPRELYPAYWQLDYQCGWALNPTHCADLKEPLWVVKFTPIYRATRGWRWMEGVITPEAEVIYNPAVGVYQWDLDLTTVSWQDLGYQCVWSVDRSLLPIDSEDIWAVKVSWTADPEGAKIMGGVLPLLTTDYNRDLGDHWHWPQPEARDIGYALRSSVCQWMVHPSLVGQHRVWAIQSRWRGLETAADLPVVQQQLEVVPLELNLERPLAVIQLSSGEPEADLHWSQLLAVAPHAQRVEGVAGIGAAHQAAALLATTDMLWIVDADAELAPDWAFDYQPLIYDRDCVHVWAAENPITGLTYGHGGVKLFPRQALLDLDPEQDLVDLTLAAGQQKLRVINRVSCATRYSSDDLSVWRTAYREAAKLTWATSAASADPVSGQRLDQWLTTVTDHPMNPVSRQGARAGHEWALTVIDVEQQSQINDREWLMKQYKQYLKQLNQQQQQAEPKPKPDVICPVPWMHLNFEPNGLVVPCCLTSTHNYFAGDLKKDTIEDIWNSDNMKSLRRDMIEGVEPKICNKCFDRERVTGESGRTYHRRDFPDVVARIPEITQPDGTCSEMKLKYWDFRFSNLCNFKCRSCGPRYSSAWVPDARKLGTISSQQEKVWNIDAVNEKTNFAFLKEHVLDVQRIYFAGGEPLLMDEHWQILDMLVEHKRFDVKLSYNTNASVLTYGKKNILDYWSQWDFGKLEVWPSIDEIGARAELIRSGTVWHKVEQNLQQLARLDNAILRPGITVGAMNVFRLPEIIMYLNQLGVLKKRHKYKNFFINLLEDPKHYHVHILPEDFRQEIIAKINQFITDYNQQFNTDIAPLLEYILHELTKPQDPDSVRRFLKVSQGVDQVRGEDIFAVIPELIRVRDGHGI